MVRREPLYNAEALQRAMEDAGLDAIVARSGRNVAYLSVACRISPIVRAPHSSSGRRVACRP
jgi:Xaa-Pro aminopeptidase